MRWSAVWALTGLLLTLSVANALTFEEALRRVSELPPVQASRLELEDAQAALARTRSDPLALRPEIIAAEQRLALARAQYEQRSYESEAAVGRAYARVLGAQEEAQLAQQRVVLNQRLLRAAQIRLENLTATELDVSDAAAALDGASGARRAAQERLGLAQRNLSGLLEQQIAAGALEPIPESVLGSTPSAAAALDAARDHPTLLEARQAEALAQFNLDILDPIFSSQTVIEEARTALRSAQAAAQETARAFEVQLRDLVAQVRSARTTYEVARETLVNARARLMVQQNRLSAGLISELELRQAEVAASEAEYAALTARNDLLTSLLALRAGSLLRLEGID